MPMHYHQLIVLISIIINSGGGSGGFFLSICESCRLCGVVCVKLRSAFFNEHIKGLLKSRPQVMLLFFYLHLSSE